MECVHALGKCPIKPTITRRRIVTNAFSGNMIQLENYTTKVVKISEEEFLELIKTADSNISHPGIARRYHLPVNPCKIKLGQGDEVIVVYIHGGKLPGNGRLPWNVHLTFEHIQIQGRE